MQKTNIQLEKIKMLQCVFGTSICNLSCGYCGWPKRHERIFGEDAARSQNTMEEISEFCHFKLPNCKIFAVTGGEPLLFPDAIQRMLECFKDMHLKISTNATLLSDKYLDAFCKHGNTSLCISLDGCDFSSNKTRYINEKIFDLVVKNIDRALEKGIFVEISCVINKNNIDKLPYFCEWMEKRWKNYLDKVIFIAYPITTYTEKDGKEVEYFFNDTQRQGLVNFLKNDIDNFFVLKKTKSYYLDLAEYLKGNLSKSKKCEKYSWCLTIEYIGSAFWTSGNFISYGCGTKGDKSLGMFNFGNKEDHNLLVERKKSKYMLEYFNKNYSDCNSKCFTNWHMIDLLFKGEFKKEYSLWSRIYKK